MLKLRVTPGMTDAALARYKDVTHLNLEQAVQITPAGLRHFESLVSLEAGNYRGTLTDAHLRFLARNPRLRNLQLAWQQGITDAGLQVLKRCSALEYVNLMGTNTGDAAVKALTGHPRLHHLSIGRQSTAAAVDSIAAMPRFQKPTRFSLQPHLTMFQSPRNHLLLDGPIRIDSLPRLQGLAGLTLFWHTPPLDLAPAAELPNLQLFGLDGKHATDAAMAQLARLPKVRHLIVQGAVASDHGFQLLARSQSLESLWGRELPNLTTAGVRALHRLRGLAVSLKNIETRVLRRFNQLRELMPMDATDAGFRHVAALPELRKLVCMYCRETGDAATEYLREHPVLESYYAGYSRITDRSLRVLATISNLRRVELEGCTGVTKAGVRELRRHVRVSAG